MATFTSSLPDDLLQLLDKKAKALGMPKNKLIERVLTICLDQLNKAKYTKSYPRMAEDGDIISMADEEMEDYLYQLVKTDEVD